MDSGAKRETGRAPTLIATAIVIAAAVLPYLPAGGGAFLRDDIPYVVDNPDVVTPGRFLALWTESFPTRSPLGLYRPLTTLSLRIDHGLFGLDPRGYHAINILQHVAAALLALLLLRRLVASRAAATAGAVLFALHWTHVEPVAWISARSELLAFVFAALTWLVLLRGEATRARLFLAASGALAATLAKESGVTTAPLAGILLLALPELSRRRRRFLATAIGAALGVFLKWFVTGSITLDPSMRHFDVLGPIARPAFALRLIGWDYPQMAIWPFDLRHDYGSLYTSSVFGWRTQGAVLVGGAAAWFVFREIRAGRGRRTLPMAFYVVAILPFAHLLTPIGETAAQRFFFTPSFALAWALGRLLDRRLPLRRLAIGLAIGATAFLLVGLERSATYRNEVALWTSDRHSLFGGERKDVPRAILGLAMSEAEGKPPHLAAAIVGRGLDAALLQAPEHPELLTRRFTNLFEQNASMQVTLKALSRLASAKPDAPGLWTLAAAFEKRFVGERTALERLELARAASRFDVTARRELARRAMDAQDFNRAQVLFEEILDVAVTRPYYAELLWAAEQLARLVSTGAVSKSEVSLAFDAVLRFLPPGAKDAQGREIAGLFEMWRRALTR